MSDLDLHYRLGVLEGQLAGLQHSLRSWQYRLHDALKPARVPRSTSALVEGVLAEVAFVRQALEKEHA